jgi:hypothetical protein
MKERTPLLAAALKNDVRLPAAHVRRPCINDKSHACYEQIRRTPGYYGRTPASRLIE